jgi:transposase
MFIRKTRKKDPISKKEYCIFQLVESFRTEKGPRQRILLNLGTDINLLDEDRKLLANRIEELINGYSQTLLPCPPEIEQLAEKYAAQLVHKQSPVQDNSEEKPTENYQSIDLDSLNHCRCRTIGLEHISYETLKELGIEQKLFDIGLTDRQVKIAIGVIVARLVRPASERATHNWLQTQSGIDEVIGTDFTKLGLRSVYQSGDILLRHKESLEAHLRKKEKTLFDLEDTIVLYDLTNTYFEGTAKGIKRAARGHSKERRTDRPLITLGLVLDKHGFPLHSEILPGNVSESKTLEKALDRLAYKQHTKPIVVLDAGIASEENLLYLREQSYRYIVAARNRSVDVPPDLEFELIKQKKDNQVHASQVKDPGSQETILYCHSTQRQQKEEAISSLLQSRLESDLKQASEALSKKGGTKSYSKVVERIGRLKERHKRISSYYDIEVGPDTTGSKAESITWKLKERKLNQRFQGSYCLRAYGLEWNSTELWSTYVMLTKVEEAFRCLKTDLGLRPIFHQIEGRVDAHLFITVLAYHAMQTIFHKLDRANMSMRWSTLQSHMASQVRVTSSMRLETGRQVHIRTTTHPEFIQKQIYKALDLPEAPRKRVAVYI